MTANFRRIFEKKPAMAMVRLGALPGAPLHDDAAGPTGLVEAARKDLVASGNDRPREFCGDAASTATMAIAGSAPKVDGHPCNPIDTDCAGEFMRLVHQARKD